MKNMSNAQTGIKKNGNEQRFPHGRFWTGMAIGVTALALPFFLKTCNPKTETIVMLPPTHKCGECHSDTTRAKGVKGAPDTLLISPSAHFEQGCDSTKKDTYNDSCGCIEPVAKKKAVRKTVVKPTPLVEKCLDCPASIAGANSPGEGVVQFVRDQFGANALELRKQLVNSDPARELRILVQFHVEADGSITSQVIKPLCTDGCGSNIDVAALAGINVTTADNGKPMNVGYQGKPCNWKFSIPIPQ